MNVIPLRKFSIVTFYLKNYAYITKKKNGNLNKKKTKGERVQYT